jgi:hypothetical protein
MKKKQYYESLPPTTERKNEWVATIVGSLLTVLLMAAIGYGLYNLITNL